MQADQIVGQQVFLAGPLAHPEMMAALGVTGIAIQTSGHLSPAPGAGLCLDGWPCWHPGPQRLTVMQVVATAALDLYLRVFGLLPCLCDGVPLLGVVQTPSGAASNNRQADWPVGQAARIASIITTTESHRSIDDIRSRLGMIGIWAGSCLRAQAFLPPQTGLLDAPDPSRVIVDDQSQPYTRYFAVQELDLRHQRHDGRLGPQIRRSVFAMGDAVVVLPYDPVRDRVLLIDQFRAAPLAMGDPQPWLLEAVAGRIDAGETPEEAARREAIEESGLQLGRLIAGPTHYPSPAAVAERIFLFVGRADLPDGVAGVHGLASEAEDIRGHLLSRGDFDRLVDDGAIRNGPLLILAYWLRAGIAQLRAQL